ncbi:actin family [Gorgonomyces haynaldii]|nr:actin family [Gorgonomyces haynaldii]
MVVFGGDQTTGIVFDIGSSLTKVGFAGEDQPRGVYSSHVGHFDMDDKRVFGDDTYKPQPGMDLTSPVKDGLVYNWDLFENLWQYSFNYLGANPQEHPMMFCEASWNPKEDREKLCELAFEKFDMPGLYLGRSAVLSAFAAGKSTALVVDSGASLTSVVPVYDGYVVKKAIEKGPIGGDFVSKEALEWLKKLNVQIVPRYAIKDKKAVEVGQQPVFQRKQFQNVRESFDNVAIMRQMHEFKESVCHVSEVPFDEKLLKKRPSKKYEFATGFSSSFGSDRFKIAESLFQSANQPTILQLMHQSVNKSDVELRPLLYQSVVLTGANTLMHGFADRLYAELHNAAPGAKIKVSAAGGSVERKFGPWIGGSMLASLDNFAPLWISKAQYQESGVSVEAKIH